MTDSVDGHNREWSAEPAFHEHPDAQILIVHLRSRMQIIRHRRSNWYGITTAISLIVTLILASTLHPALLLLLPLGALLTWSSMKSDLASAAQLALIRKQAAHILLSCGLLAEILEASEPAALREGALLLELAREQETDYHNFGDAVSRMDFLLEHYLLICRTRSWKWKGEPTGEAVGRGLAAGDGLPGRPVHFGHEVMNYAETLAFIETLIDILQAQADSNALEHRDG